MSVPTKPEMDLADRLARAMTRAVERKQDALHAAAERPAETTPAASAKASAVAARSGARPAAARAPGAIPGTERPKAARTANVVEMRPGITSRPAAEDQSRWPLPGLAPMTRVRTDFGDVHSIALRKGDKVLTRSGAYRPILWIKRIRLDSHVLNTKTDSNPVVIAKGALGNLGEIAVSPRQQITADETSGLAETREAAMLLSHSGVRRLRETGLTYTMFHLGQDAEVCCEGLYLTFPMEA
ncbi:MAG: Hint domain-containing protein [Silicimonas sp.]|nr:Hint domain-containing protein [Silicimonas sp.]